MAKKKTRRKKGRKRKATAAQMRGLRKAWAARRKKTGGRRKKKRKASKRRRKRTTSVASHMKASLGRGFGAASYSAPASVRRKRSKAVRKALGQTARKQRRKKVGTVTAASILKGAKSARHKAWICAGPRRSGCGGGRRGGHVVGVLR